MVIAPHFIIHETAHWLLNHHMSSKLPGYLVLGTRYNARSLAELPEAALIELGGLLGKVQRILQTQLQPKWLYISRFGHDPAFPIHFHCIPVYHWVEELFWQDDRYRLLKNFGAGANAHALTDGAELTLFIWREFGESPEPPSIQGPGVEEIIERLRLSFQGEG